MKVARNVKERRKLLEDIKDEIDRLHEIPSKGHRENVARDLVEYIKLHHLDGAERDGAS
jgi:hypothetical protein